jgi:hypothetical protein
MADTERSLQSCPGHGKTCHAIATKKRPCGCVEFACGSTLTCDDYHHGDGVLLDCPLEGNAE